MLFKRHNVSKERFILFGLLVLAVMFRLVELYLAWHTGDRDGKITTPFFSFGMILLYVVLAIIGMIVILKMLSIPIKYVIFALFPAMALLFCTELALRMIFYQQQSKYTFALSEMKDNIQHLFFEQRVKQAVAGTEDVPQEIRSKLFEALYKEEGHAVLTKFQKEYEQQFAALVQEANAIRTKLLVLYIPSSPNVHDPAMAICRKFYQELAIRYQVDYLDLTEDWYDYPIEWSTLLPENSHLSRFGNRRIVEKLSAYLDQYSAYRSPIKFDQRPSVLGDLNPNMNAIYTVKPEMVYRVISNKQGFRMEHDLTFPKEQQRILVLGDSFTFGPYLPNWHCYPNLLDKQYADKEVINAGIAGYTITDEASLFMGRAKYVEPDITILQVLDNDLLGLFYFMRNQFDRKQPGTFHPSQEESDLIAALRQ
ncbi:MAG: hypothetical protein JXN60_02115 [Lentisphaerae bacterium]|nr:hypothetical protein [Lentisphaerota bacterium]